MTGTYGRVWSPDPAELFGVPGGRLPDRRGPRDVVTTALSLAFIAPVLYLFVTDPIAAGPIFTPASGRESWIVWDRGCSGCGDSGAAVPAQPGDRHRARLPPDPDRVRPGTCPRPAGLGPRCDRRPAGVAPPGMPPAGRSTGGHRPLASAAQPGLVLRRTSTGCRPRTARSCGGCSPPARETPRPPGGMAGRWSSSASEQRHRRRRLVHDSRVLPHHRGPDRLLLEDPTAAGGHAALQTADRRSHPERPARHPLHARHPRGCPRFGRAREEIDATHIACSPDWNRRTATANLTATGSTMRRQRQRQRPGRLAFPRKRRGAAQVDPLEGSGLGGGTVQWRQDADPPRDTY